MAWNEKLTAKYLWHHFDSRWDLLPALAQEPVQFLQSLDLFVCPLGHTFTEAWGRSTVEAMLTGAVPLVPTGHHLENLIVHGKTGFLCEDFQDFKRHAQELFWNADLRKTMAVDCRHDTVERLCNRAEHLTQWLEVFA